MKGGFREMRPASQPTLRAPHVADVPDHLWTASDAARFLQVSTRTLRRLIYSQNLPCLRLGSRLRFFPADVFVWLRRRKEE